MMQTANTSSSAEGAVARQNAGPRARRVVGIADMQLSSDPDEVLVTYALGSCLGVSVFDPVAGVAGLLHFMLPQAALSPDKAASNPFMFADTGVPKLFLGSYALGAKKERLIVTVAGGAAFNVSAADDDGIGQRNFAILRKLLWKNTVLLKKHDVGGAEPRNMTVDVRTGAVSLTFAGVTRSLFEGIGT